MKKLVRDKIPEIIEKNGEKYSITILSDEEYFTALQQKLKEETEELLATTSREEQIAETADVLEVLEAMLEFSNIDMKEVKEYKQSKLLERGGFSKRIMLEK